MTDVTVNQTDVAAQAVLDKNSIDKCTKGLVDKFNSPVQGIDVSNKPLGFQSSTTSIFLIRNQFKTLFFRNCREVGIVDNSKFT